MNKELIKKYKPEFDHWLNGGSLLARVITSDEDDFMYTIWYMVDSNNLEKWKATSLFSLTNTQIKYYKPQFVINDEYSEFRKALAEGKTIEYIGQSSNVWHEVQESDFNLHPTCYRIKPDESKFKVGDFVTPLNREINCSVWQINNILSCNTLVSNSIMLDPRTIQPWTPVKGEWCWFYDSKSSKSSYLAEFKQMSRQFFESEEIGIYDYCEPFLNSLPSYLKDK